MRPARQAQLDVELLALLIARVDESADAQGMTLSPSSRAKLVARMYAEHDGEAAGPDELTTDRMVWLYCG